MRFASVLLAASLVAITGARASEDAPAPQSEKSDLSGLHAFDFIAGKWRAHHRKLKERLAGSHDWVEFDGTQDARIVLGGYGNEDDNVFDVPGGAYRGETLRAYDPKTGEWLIWWLDGRSPTANMDPPLRGRFVNGVGTFYADDTLRGKPVKLRFIWKPLTHNTSHWEQALSGDGGKTWETNWTTDFTRVAEGARQ